MYATPTPVGRNGTVPGRKLGRPRASLGTTLSSPTFSTSSQGLGRKGVPNMPTSPGTRSAVASRASAPGGSPESGIRVGDAIRAPSGEIGTVRYVPREKPLTVDLLALLTENKGLL